MAKLKFFDLSIIQGKLLALSFYELKFIAFNSPDKMSSAFLDAEMRALCLSLDCLWPHTVFAKLCLCV